MRTTRARQKGFTFVEMALSLFSVGFLLAAVPRIISQGQEALASAPGAVAIDSAELALNGFVLLNNRLPCPASTPSSGLENCALTRGFVPYKTLRLPQPMNNSSGFPMGYAVLADDANNNHLGKATAKFTPQYLNASASYWQTPGTLSSSVVNGLDFCAKLRHAATLTAQPQQTGVKNARGSGGVNAAWVLIDPGVSNADGDTAGIAPQFDGANNPTVGSAWFESPAKAQTQGYDDTVRVGTLTQMYSELRCPDLLAAMSAAAREADFSDDHWRVRKFLYDFRAYELNVREQKKTNANNARLMAIFDISLTVASSSLDLGVALAGASGAAAIAVSAITAVTAISLSADGLNEAIKGYNDAIDEVTEGQARKADAQSAVDDADAFRTSRRNALLTLDQRSWFQ